MKYGYEILVEKFDLLRFNIEIFSSYNISKNLKTLEILRDFSIFPDIYEILC